MKTMGPAIVLSGKHYLQIISIKEKDGLWLEQLILLNYLYYNTYKGKGKKVGFIFQLSQLSDWARKKNLETMFIIFPFYH